MNTNFYESVKDELLKFAVIVARYGDQYVFCKHKARKTLEVPGGHREAGETIEETARRELYEETGALEFSLEPVCVYSVVTEEAGKRIETFGMLYFAQIKTFEGELHSEIEEYLLLEQPPEEPEVWTYPEIQPYLVDQVKKLGFLEGSRS